MARPVCACVVTATLWKNVQKKNKLSIIDIKALDDAEPYETLRFVFTYILWIQLHRACNEVKGTITTSSRFR